jgi:hypothetical protein
VHDDAFDDHDGIVDHQADGGSETAESHQVKALANDPEKQNGHGDRNRDNQACNERGAPVTEKEEENDAREKEANENGVPHAGDAFANEFGLVVEGLELHARRKFRSQLRNFCRDGICHSNGVTGGLACDIEQYRRLAVRRNHGVDGHGRRLDAGNIGDADRSAAGSGFDHQLSEFVRAVRLRTDKAKDELMVCFIEPR